MKRYFTLFNSAVRQPVCDIEMDDSLLSQEAGIIDAESFNMPAFKNGAMFTLIPIDVHHTEFAISKVQSAYKSLTEKPTVLLSHYTARIDALIEAVGSLFGTVEYFVVECADDMNALINPFINKEPKKVTYKILDLLESELSSGDSKPVESHEHVHAADGSCCH